MTARRAIEFAIATLLVVGSMVLVDAAGGAIARHGFSVWTRSCASSAKVSRKAPATIHLSASLRGHQLTYIGLGKGYIEFAGRGVLVHVARENALTPLRIRVVSVRGDCPWIRVRVSP